MNNNYRDGSGGGEGIQGNVDKNISRSQHFATCSTKATTAHIQSDIQVIKRCRNSDGEMREKRE